MSKAAAWLRVFSDTRVMLGTAGLALLFLTAIFAPWLAPHDPNEQDLLNTLLPPMWAADGLRAFPLGTDSLGQCILSRLIYSTRVVALVAVLAPLGAALVGVPLAIMAGYWGGKVDWLIMRMVDVWMSFPAVVLAMVFMVALSPGLTNVIIAIVAVDWTRFCRVLRSEVLVLRRRDYIAAARLTGATPLQVIRKDIMPGLMPTLLALLSIEMGIAIIAEAVLSFVGVSMAPSTPTWGMMISDGLKSVFSAPYGLIAPVVCMIVTVLACTLLGDGLRKKLDPRLLERVRG
ncbi:ABC transporter permease [Lampropedia cohaerens]|uniref:ABC transporter permease n=2 Tax=Lampropedia cohaerens TaxID=1610491 RepID=A0A0U1Q0A2_9BURK|nr:ABC transporter permease [Lampropedia cohaerens]